jgi:hypothetical protein
VKVVVVKGVHVDRFARALSLAEGDLAEPTNLAQQAGDLCRAAK